LYGGLSNCRGTGFSVILREENIGVQENERPSTPEPETSDFIRDEFAAADQQNGNAVDT
jgi:hypothetical protein